MEQPLGIADVDGSRTHGGRSLDRSRLVFPFLLASRQIDGVKVFVERADVNNALYDGGCAVDTVLGRKLPQHIEFVRQRDGRYARLLRIAAEDGPIVLRRIIRSEAQTSEESDDTESSKITRDHGRSLQTN